MITAPPKLRVMVIDDHTLICEGVTAMVASQPDMEVCGAVGDAHEAFTVLAASKPDVLVADINIGSSIIFPFLERIRQLPHVPAVVLLTGFPTSVNIERALESGVGAILWKSETSDELLRAIRSVAQGETFFGPAVAKIVETLRPQRKMIEFEGGDRGVLTSRERDVLACIGNGLSREGIAKSLFISIRTVDRHRQSIMDKLGMHREAELVRYAIAEGYASIDVAIGVGEEK